MSPFFVSRRAAAAPSLLSIACFFSVSTATAEGLQEPPAERRAGAADDDDPAAPVALPTLVVTGTAVAADPRRLPAQTDVLDAAALRERADAGLGAALERLPGVASLATGEQASAPVLRGLSGNRVLLLVDGVPQSYQQFGVRHPPNIDPALGARVELLRGPASLLYGSDAMGGVVQVFSADPLHPDVGESGWRLRGALDHSSAHRSLGRQLQASATDGTWGADAQLSWRDSDGFCTPTVAEAAVSDDPDAPLASGCLPSTDYAQRNGALALGWQNESVRLRLRAQQYDNAQNYLQPDPPAQRGAPVTAGGIGQHLQQSLLRAALEIDAGDWLLAPQLDYATNRRRANVGGADPQPLPVTGDPANIDVERHSLHGRLSLQHPRWLGIEGQFGAEFNRDLQDSRGPNPLVPGGVLEGRALFVLEQWQNERWTVQAGARRDWRTQRAEAQRTANAAALPTDPALLDRSYVADSAGIGLSRALGAHWLLAGNLASAFRVPDFFELYGAGLHNGVAAIQRGNPMLRPERAQTMDLSLRADYAGWDAQATLYRTRIGRYVSLVDSGQTDTNGTPIFDHHQKDAELDGGDLAARWRFAPHWQLNLGYERVLGRYSADGRPLPLLPPDTLTAGLELRGGDWGRLRAPWASLEARWVSARDAAGPEEPFFSSDAPTSPFGVASTTAYTRYDFAAGTHIGALELGLQLRNLLDTPYYDFLDTYKTVVMAPGRDLRLHLGWQFGAT